ncbi:MAG: glycosyltransferase [Casimicrobiaceae bacterium]
MQPIGRNQPCPCASGKRYKECHGDIATTAALAVAAMTAPLDPVSTLLEATQRLEAADVAGAAALGQEALQRAPGHPEALRILGRCDYENGEPEAGLRKLLAAARSMQTFPLSAPRQYAIWSDLGFMFTQALSGMDSVFAGRKRAEYVRWQSASAGDERPPEPLVSIVLLAKGRAEQVLSALRTACGQSYANIELVLVDDAATQHGMADALATCRFPWRRIAAGGMSEPAQINAGVRGSTGAFVNVLDARDRLGVDRIATMVRQVAAPGRAWGFGNAAFTDDEGRSLSSEHDPAVARAVDLLAGIAEADTVGFSLIHQAFVGVAAGNLFFSRELFDRIGGFRDLPHHWAWDFGLRALWFDEPVYVSSAGYTRCAVAQDSPLATHEPSDLAQISMFREFYAGACGDVVPPNLYAPSLHHWRRHFLKTPFQVGHVLAFPIEQLEILGRKILEPSVPVVAQAATAGVNLVGFAYGEFGLGENLRALASACRVGAIPFAVLDVDMRLKTRQADRSVAPHIVDELRHNCSLFCVNPDMLKPVVRLMKPKGGVRRYNIGFWFWELEQVPRGWGYAIESVDEIWVATEFIAAAMRVATVKPVTKIHTPIEVKLSRAYARHEFGLPEHRFLFLFSFDFNSFAMRKNPEGAIAAFKQAFDKSRRDVGLVIKSINGGNKPEKLRAMRELIGNDHRIVIVDGFMSRDQVFGLQSVVDAYVSLHRAEGLGLGLAESMYLGKPVIGTAYSGNLEFMSPENSCLVDYRLIAIQKGQYIVDDERFRWAEPDVAQAAHWMTRLVDDAEFRGRIAARGQSDVRGRFTHANTAAAMRQRLAELRLL